MIEQKYGYIVDDILTKIKKGEYVADQKLPTEKEFCKLYGASQSTVKKALKQLITDGYIYSVERVGNYVAKPVTDEFIFSYDYTTILDKALETSKERISTADVEVAVDPSEPDKLYKALEVKGRLKRSKTTVCYRKWNVLYNRGVNSRKIRLGDEEVDAIISQIRKMVKRSRIIVQPMYPEGELAQEIECRPYSLYFEITRWDYDDYGKVVCYSQTYVKGSDFSITAKSR
jgi:DNA-binding GntR family transcriptional regulator